MLVTTSAPIIEETSSANGKKKSGTFKRKAGDTFRRGYSQLKEAGGLPVIENLLKLNTGTGMGTGTIPNENLLPPVEQPLDTTKPPMSTTKKVVIAVLILGAIGGAYYYFNKSTKGATKGAKKSK